MVAGRRGHDAAAPAARMVPLDGAVLDDQARHGRPDVDAAAVGGRKVPGNCGAAQRQCRSHINGINPAANPKVRLIARDRGVFDEGLARSKDAAPIVGGVADDSALLNSQV